MTLPISRIICWVDQLWNVFGQNPAHLPTGFPMSSPLLIATAISAALAMGLVQVLFRILQGPLQQTAHLSEAKLERLQMALTISWIPLMPLAGWFVDRWGVYEVLFGGSLLLAMAISWIGLCQNPTGVIWGVLGLGTAGACVTTAGICLMPEALTLSSRWSAGASLCLGFVFVGLAALLAPIVIPEILRRAHLPRTALALGLFCLMPAVFVAMVQMTNAQRQVGGLPTDAPLYDVRFWLVALVAFLYFSLEKLLESWPRGYLLEMGYDARDLARLIIGFWLAFLFFRFGLAWLVRPGNEAWLVLVLSVASSMILGNLVGADAPISGYVGFWLVGASYGPILPALLAILDLDGTDRISAQEVGAIFALQSVSQLLVQPLLARFAKWQSPRASMRLAMIIGLLMAAPALVLALIRFRS